jgi:hypothetical protein
MILKTKGVSVDIQTAANLVGDATIVSVINTNTAPVLIVNSNGNNLWIAAGERVLIKKEYDETLQATTGATTEVWATPVAYLA